MDAFGWYNVTGTAPRPSDLYTAIDCDAALGTEATLDILSDPRYSGGKIGFFLITPESHAPGSCSGGDCCGTAARVSAGEGYVFYSERNYNPDYAGQNSHIHLLTYVSHLVETSVILLGEISSAALETITSSLRWSCRSRT